MMEISTIPVKINDCCKLFVKKIFDDDSETIITTSQRTDEWLQFRKFRVTGSRVYELYTYSKADWNTKCMTYFHRPNITNKYVKHGLKYEEDAIKTFSENTKLEVLHCGMVVPHNNSWLGYSPDGIIIENGKRVLLEVKCLYEGIFFILLFGGHNYVTVIFLRCDKNYCRSHSCS